MYARHVTLAFTATLIALGVCLTGTSALGDVKGGLGHFFSIRRCPAARESTSGSLQSSAAVASAQTAENDNRYGVVPAGCDCQSTRLRSGRKTEKLVPIPAPVAEGEQKRVKDAEPLVAAPKQPVRITPPRLLPLWEETRQSGFFPTPIVAAHVTDQADEATVGAARRQAKSDPPRKRPPVDPLEAKRRHFRDAIHLTVSDAGVVLVPK
jgi:hypothetical protein